MKKKFQASDDGLLTPEVGPWSDKKYKLIQNYAEVFATGMKHKWDCRGNYSAKKAKRSKKRLDRSFLKKC